MAAIRLDSFKGINNKAHQSKMPPNYLRECIDAHIDNSGMVVKREGYTRQSSDDFTALWSDGLRCFAVKNGDLVEVIDNGDSYSFTTLRAGVGYYDMVFAECDGRYYYVNRLVNGIIGESGDQTFGMAQVNYQPTLASSNGSMLAGTYLVAVTALDANGLESGTKEPATITITDNKQIQLSNIYTTSDTRVTHIAIYCSTQNGSELYRIGTISAGTTTYTITAANAYGFPLQDALIGANPAPLGDLIAYHYGHLYIASGKYLFYSDAWRYERWRPQQHYKYPSNITIVLPCESGLWVSTEKDGLFWLSGKNPKHSKEVSGDISQARKHIACIKKGSARRIEAEFIGNGNSSYGYMATAKEGLFLLLDGGQFANISQDNINMPTFTHCSSAIVNDSDSFKYVAILAGETLPLRTI